MRNYVSQSTAISTPRLILSISLLFAGISLILPLPAAPSTLPLPEVQIQSVEVITQVASGTTSQLTLDSKSWPTQVIIPKLGIDMPVSPSKIVSGYWQVSSTKASYGVGSGLVGKPGNAVIFAHSRPGQFLNLKSITLGTKIHVIVDQKIYSYTVNSKKNVSPTDLAVIAPSNNQLLTLYTCDGLNDSERFVVQATAAGN